MVISDIFWYATFDVQYLEKLIRTMELVEKYFEDPENGGYYLYASDGEKLLIRPKELYDGALPSGNGMIAYLLVYLAHLTGETIWTERSNRQLCFLCQDGACMPPVDDVEKLELFYRE